MSGNLRYLDFRTLTPCLREAGDGVSGRFFSLLTKLRYVIKSFFLALPSRIIAYAGSITTYIFDRKPNDNMPKESL